MRGGGEGMGHGSSSLIEFNEKKYIFGEVGFTHPTVGLDGFFLFVLKQTFLSCI